MITTSGSWRLERWQGWGHCWSCECVGPPWGGRRSSHLPPSDPYQGCTQHAPEELCWWSVQPSEQCLLHVKSQDEYILPNTLLPPPPFITNTSSLIPSSLPLPSSPIPPFSLLLSLLLQYAPPSIMGGYLPSSQ